VFERIEDEWEKFFGRSYGIIEPYRTGDADLVLVTSGTITSTARHTIDLRRERGERVGLVKVKMFRPFPAAALRDALRGIERVIVIDRNLSPGNGGIFAEELRSALYDLPDDERPALRGTIVGLGGRNVTPETIDRIIDTTSFTDAAGRPDLWVGVKA
jgi:pyruvate/2-oxoacid:ferredoxin oxidoreductase alpha subunit